ncbi:MAG: hypothetical protein L3V56_02740 [Candidatus Magnetoovum sp. WYHC-5]|nr:hypothetical protein [Candidatus Magnetoovum sp. WYHC-5]
MLSEVQFLEQERDSLIKLYKQASDALVDYLTEIGNSIIDMDFIKGEIAALTDKLKSIEDKLPTKLNDLEYIEDKIKWSKKAIKELSKRIQDVKISSKEFYYKKMDYKPLDLTIDNRSAYDK